jgi:ABC-2 type transport system permease protein
MEAFLYSSSLKDFLRPARLLPWIVLAIAAMGLGAVWKQLSPNSTQVEQYSNVAFILVFRLLALTSAVFTTAIISQEVEQKTIVYLLTRPIPRWKLLLFRWLASITAVTIVGAIGVFLLSVGVYKDPFKNGLMLSDMWAIFLGACAYGSLFLLISLLFNRAMIICLLFAFGWETSVPNMPGEIYYASIFSHLQAVAQHPAPTQNGGKGMQLISGQMNANMLSASTSLPILIVMTVLLVAASMWWFTHFEYVPREDAE